MDDNIQDCCRICLDVESTHVSIVDNPTINLHIKSCLPINIATTDNLPKSICESCVSQLNAFYNFQLNARCSQDWLESSLQEKTKKSTENKIHVQPLPDSEYNSDSLLEFLNNTSNIEEYLNNLGKEDIPSIVNMLDRTVGTENHKTSNNKLTKVPSPKKKESLNKSHNSIAMDIDVLDSDIEIVNELLTKETEPKKQVKTSENFYICFACNTNLDSVQKLSHHLNTCDNALRTCAHCNILFNSKREMREHLLTHGVVTPLTCNCGKRFESKENLIKHCRKCVIDHVTSMGFEYACKQCGEKFDSRLYLYKHAREHVLKGQERICDKCGHTFIGDDALTEHKNNEHGNLDDVLYKCKICKFSSDDRKKMYSHVQKHTKDKVKEQSCHLCESCGQKFATEATLYRHSLQHTQKNYKCKVCNKRFTELKLKHEHMLEHVEMCDRCGQCVQNFNLSKHNCT